MPARRASKKQDNNTTAKNDLRDRTRSPVRRRTRGHEQAVTTPSSTRPVRHIVSKLPARVYKRWIFASIIGSLVFSWFVFPFYFDTRFVPEKLGQVSEFLFENALFKMMPNGGIFGDDFLGNISAILQPFWSSEYEQKRSPGRILRAKGVKAKYPVVLVPGITSTGLELWQGKSCAESYFRQRLWGTLTMMRFMVMDSACWIQHLKLDAKTGGDPEGIKLRPAQGLEAADFILPGFWVWARIIENLAEIGYDHNNLMMAAYDWRLDIMQLEKRDHYFSRLKAHIELLVKTRGEKVVILSHSLGSIVWYYFMKWVESGVGTEGITGGAGGRNWIEKHIHATTSIGAPYLGVPKAICMIMSGEMRDTAQMGKFETLLLDMLMSKRERLGLFRTWLGGFAMLPKGGNFVWGDGRNAETLVDAPEGVAYPLVTIREKKHDKSTSNVDEASIAKSPACNEDVKTSFTYDEIDSILSDFMPSTGYEIIKNAYSWGIASSKEMIKNDDHPSTWTNPLEARLPNAPSLKMYCFYGVSKDTERAYEYEPILDTEWRNEWHRALGEEEKLHFQRSDDINDMLIRYRIDLGRADEAKKLSTGIYHVDGDGTVPVLSTGYMCVHGWRNYRHLNPANVSITTREYPHEPSGLSLTDIRGGPKASEHVDILGNHEMTMDILKIVSGWSETGEEGAAVEERIISQIREMARKIKIPF